MSAGYSGTPLPETFIPAVSGSACPRSAGNEVPPVSMTGT
jgi:hypothetical protein